MTNRNRAIAWIILILCQEFHVKGKAVPGPTSGVMIQDMPGFILTEKRILSRKIYVSLDPSIAIEKRFNTSEFKSEFLKEWYRTHLEYSRERVRQILESTRKTFIRDEISVSQRPKRFISAIVAALVFAVVGSVIATGVSAANSISIQRYQEELVALKKSLLEIQRELNLQRRRLLDVVSVVDDTIVTTNLHSKLLMHSTNLHKSHEEFKEELLFVKEPIDFFTQVFHDELQSGMDDLREGRIPLYFVSRDIVKKMLQQNNVSEVEDIHVNLAFNMGNAIPLYIDPERMEICFLLSVPYVTSKNIFLIKKVHNVGTWQGDVYVKIQTPEMVAYQPWNPDWYYVPMLDNCIKFRDNNYQCEGNPFHYDATNVLCGLEYEKHGSENCQVSLSKPTDNVNTYVALIHDRWLVSTSLPNMSIFNTDYVLNRVVALPANVVIIDVPARSKITVGKSTLYPIDIGEIEGAVEGIDAFQNKEIPMNPDLQFLLEHKPNHMVKINIRKDEMSINDMQYIDSDKILLKSFVWDPHLNYMWGILIIIIMGWLIFLTVKLIRWVNFTKKVLAKFWAMYGDSENSML